MISEKTAFISLNSIYRLFSFLLWLWVVFSLRYDYEDLPWLQRVKLCNDVIFHVIYISVSC